MAFPASKPILLAAGDVDRAAEILQAYDVQRFPDLLADEPYAHLVQRLVDIWPANTAAGYEAAASLAGELISLDVAPQRVRVLLPAGPRFEAGWTLSDAIAAGWSGDQLIAHARREEGVWIKLYEVEATKEAAKPRRKSVTLASDYADAKKDASRFVSWETLELDKDSKGIPYPTEANALRILTGHEHYAGRIWLEQFSQKLMLDERQFGRPDAIGILVWMQSTMQIHKITLSAVERAAVLVGQQNARHPLKDWLDSLTWDRHERLPTLMSDGWGTPDNDYTEAVGRCWLVSLVARVYDPGCQADYMPVFEGSQGIFKSSSLRALGGDWFLENHEDPIANRKDFLSGLQGKWLIEIPEMHSIAGRSNGVDKVKGIITCRNDTYRVPYGATTMDYPRQCVFAGTTNRDAWNPDPTGGRRFWPIACGSINLDYIRSQREQLLAEALARYKRGESWHDVPLASAQREQEDRREHDEWESIIEHFITHHPKRDSQGVMWIQREEELKTMLMADVLGIALNMREGDWTRSDQIRVSNCFQALGWKKFRPQIDGERRWAYKKVWTG